MQESYAVPTEQWSMILSTVWSWLWAGLSWILDFQRQIFEFTLYGDTALQGLGKGVLLFLPAVAVVAGVWGTMVSLYTLPFRSGRGRFLAAVLMSWWDGVRMVWFFWAGLGRFVFVVIGWIWGLIKLAASLVWQTIKEAALSPFTLLDWTSRRYFQPGVPWIAFFLVLAWSAIEATIFTFTLRPTMSELLADMTGYELNQVALTSLLWLFLFPLIGGSFACVQVLNEAIRSREIGQIISMTLVEFVVAFFEVLFLYRELVDAITPWLAQQGVTLGVGGTVVLGFFGWVGVRGMTWFLFGRYGTPALLAVLARQTITHDQGAAAAAVRPPEAALWQGPVKALKADIEWVKREAREVFELASLPVLQLLAAAFNFGVVVILGHPHFSLPFRSLDEVLASTPSLESPRAAKGGAA